MPFASLFCVMWCHKKEARRVHPQSAPPEKAGVASRLGASGTAPLAPASWLGASGVAASATSAASAGGQTSSIIGVRTSSSQALHPTNILFGSEYGRRTVQQLLRRLEKSLDPLLLACLEPVLQIPPLQSVTHVEAIIQKASLSSVARLEAFQELRHQRHACVCWLMRAAYDCFRSRKWLSQDRIE